MAVFCNRYMSPEIVADLCMHIGSLKHLALLARTCTQLKHLIYSMDACWLNAASLFCGKDYWITATNAPGYFNEIGGHRFPARYAAMMAACPWMSKPVETHLQLIRSIYSMGGSCTIQGARQCNDHIVVKIEMQGHYSPVLRRGKRPAFIHLFGKSLQHAYMQSSSEEYRPQEASEREIELMASLHGFRPEMHYTTRLRSVRLVHQNLMCAIYVDDADPEAYGTAVLYFVSIPTRRAVHTIELRGQVSHIHDSLIFRPGQMWLCTDHQVYPSIRHYGPRDDRALNGLPCVCDVFWSAFGGDIGPALTLDVPDIYSLRENQLTLADATILGGNCAALARLIDRFPHFASLQALNLAVKTGSYMMTDLLLSKGVDPSADGSAVLHHAVGLGSPCIFDLLIQHGAQISICCLLEHITPRTPIGVLMQMLKIDAVSCASLPLLILWLQRGGDYSKHIYALREFPHTDPFNDATDLHETPLMYAAGTLIPANVQALLDCKADVTRRDEEGKTAADWLEAAMKPNRPGWFLDAYEDFTDIRPTAAEALANGPIIREMLKRANK